MNSLEATIENLYDVFATYPMPARMDGCPCCVSDGDKEQIHLKELREITGDEISRYASKAMTTWGGVEDFKYYLPRIFELLTFKDFYPDADIVLGKLEYGKWHQWNQNEQEAIRTFLIAWWQQLLSDENDFSNCNFAEISKALRCSKPLFDAWNADFESNNFRILISFIFEHYSQYQVGKKMSADEYTSISNWLKKQEYLIEQGFYKYEKQELDFAQNISYCYDIVHRIAL